MRDRKVAPKGPGTLASCKPDGCRSGRRHGKEGPDPDAGLSIYRQPGESIPLPDASVDLGSGTSSFHHWQDQAQGIREIRPDLRPGGRFILSDMMIPKFLLKFIHHGKFRNAGEVREMFEQVGFEVKAQRRSLLGKTLVTVGIRSE